MYLNTLKPARGAKTARRRLGRGIGSGLGKTSGKGHKGQRARAGGYHKVGFEGGQTPLKRRLPKFGFFSRMALDHAEVRLGDLEKFEMVEIDLEVLRSLKIIKAHIQRVKIILQGKITRRIAVKGLGVTKGAREAIIAAGGSVE